MAHFAQLNENDEVVQVVVVNNVDISDLPFPESELVGVAFCQSLFGVDTSWAQTSFNSNFRKNYAGVGYFYDRARDAFIPPKPFASWVLNEATCLWDAPVPYPVDVSAYSRRFNEESGELELLMWNSDTNQWELVEEYPAYQWDEGAIAWVEATP